MNTFYHLPENILNEFYFNASGKIYAKSLRAIGRLSGVSKNTVGELLVKIKNTPYHMLHKCLQPLKNKNLNALSKISLEDVKRILKYYYLTGRCSKEGCLILNLPWYDKAFEHELYNKTENFQSEPNFAESKDSKIDDLLTEILSMRSDMATINAKLSRFDKIVTQFPGIATLNLTVNNDHQIPANLKEPFTMRKYVQAFHNRTLTRSECCSLGRCAAASYTIFKYHSPKHLGTAAIYKLEDVSVLSAIYQGWVDTRK